MAGKVSGFSGYANYDYMTTLVDTPNRANSYQDDNLHIYSKKGKGKILVTRSSNLKGLVWVS